MSILNQLYQWNREQAYTHILNTYQEQGYFVLSFLYFANAMHERLLEPPVTDRHINYKHALWDADLILPDGIALQMFYRVGRWVWLHNLNGTDFIPYFFDRLWSSDEDVHIGFFTLYDPRPEVNKTLEQLEDAKQAFYERFGLTIDFSTQIEYVKRMTDTFDLQGYETSLNQSKAQYKILFMGLGTPAQEIWCHQHQDFIRKHNLLVINAGGTMDYISWFEQRAPERVVRARVLETIWRITSKPGKNLRKFLWMFGIVRYRWYSIKSWLANLLLKK